MSFDMFKDFQATLKNWNKMALTNFLPAEVQRACELYPSRENRSEDHLSCRSPTKWTYNRKVLFI